MSLPLGTKTPRLYYLERMPSAREGGGIQSLKNYEVSIARFEQEYIRVHCIEGIKKDLKFRLGTNISGVANEGRWTLLCNFVK